MNILTPLAVSPPFELVAYPLAGRYHPPQGFMFRDESLGVMIRDESCGFMLRDETTEIAIRDE